MPILHWILSYPSWCLLPTIGPELSSEPKKEISLQCTPERLPGGLNEIKNLKYQVVPSEITQHFSELTVGTWGMVIPGADSIQVLI